MAEHLVYDSRSDGNCLFNSIVIDIAQNIRTHASEDQWLALFKTQEHKRHYVQLINQVRANDKKLSKDESFPKVTLKTSPEELFAQFKALFTTHYDIKDDKKRDKIQRLVSPILREMVFGAVGNEKLKVRDINNKVVPLKNLLDTYMQDAIEDSVVRYVRSGGLVKGSQAFESFSPIKKQLKKLFKKINLEKLNDSCNRYDALKTRLDQALIKANKHVAEDNDEPNPFLREQTLAIKVKKLLDKNELNVEPSLKKKVAVLYKNVSDQALAKPKTKAQRDKITHIAEQLTAIITDYRENKRVGFAKAELDKRLAPKVKQLQQWFDNEGRDLFFNDPDTGLMTDGVWVNQVGLELFSSLFGVNCLFKYLGDSENRQGFPIYPEDAVWQVCKRLNTQAASKVESQVEDNDVVIRVSHTGGGHWEACLPLTGTLKKSIQQQIAQSKQSKAMKAFSESLPLSEATGQVNSVLAGFGVSGLVAMAGVFVVQAAPIMVVATCALTFLFSMFAADAYQQRYPKVTIPDAHASLEEEEPEENSAEHSLEDDLKSASPDVSSDAKPAITPQFSAASNDSSEAEEAEVDAAPKASKKASARK